VHNETAPERPSRTRLRRALSTFAVVLSLAYCVGLVCSIVAFRWVGERWWVTVVALYLPRVGFALPLPVVLVVAALWGPRWLWAAHTLSVYLLLFPLMGLNLGLGRMWVSSRGPSLRLVSYNIDDGRRGLGSAVTQVREFFPDVVLMQEAYPEVTRRLRTAFAGWNVHCHGQFFIASRWPIKDVYVPRDVGHQRRRAGAARFVRYTLETPLGAVDVLNVHPVSPSEGFAELRGNELRDELKSGRTWTRVARRPIEFNALHRRRQIEAIASAARASPRPVIIAGDTNLPNLSWALGKNLGDFRDGFTSAGRGFGYTFPTKHPWLRIDRVMTNDKLRITDFRVGTRNASDHLCVFATVTKDN
jgi:vancomycin resistance protein VanJ